MDKEVNKIFEQWEQFLSWCYENNDKTTEIHRDNLEKIMAYTRQVENIIKEVREYLDIDESIRKTCKRYDVNGIDILEILDKGEK